MFSSVPGSDQKTQQDIYVYYNKRTKELQSSHSQSVLSH